MIYSKENPGYVQVVDSQGNALDFKLTSDGKLMVDTSLTINSVTATDVTIKDATNPANRQKINSDGSSNVVVTGSRVVEETLVNAASVAPGSFTTFNIIPTTEDEIWLAVSIDQQPWGILTSTQAYSGSDGAAGTIYPQRSNVTTVNTINTPSVSLFLGGLNMATSWGLTAPTSMQEAKQYAIPYKSNAAARVTLSGTAGGTATVTVKVYRVWKSGGRR